MLRQQHAVASYCIALWESFLSNSWYFYKIVASELKPRYSIFPDYSIIPTSHLYILKTLEINGFSVSAELNLFTTRWLIQPPPPYEKKNYEWCSQKLTIILLLSIKCEKRLLKCINCDFPSYEMISILLYILLENKRVGNDWSINKNNNKYRMADDRSTV